MSKTLLTLVFFDILYYLVLVFLQHENIYVYRRYGDRMVIVLSLHGVEWSDLDEVEECLPVLDNAHSRVFLHRGPSSMNSQSLLIK